MRTMLRMREVPTRTSHLVLLGFALALLAVVHQDRDLSPHPLQRHLTIATRPQPQSKHVRGRAIRCL